MSLYFVERKAMLKHLKQTNKIIANNSKEILAMENTSSNPKPTLEVNEQGTAVIYVYGILMETVPRWYQYLDISATSYNDIAILSAEANKREDINNVIFAIDSAGGTVEGYFKAATAISAIEKPTQAIINNECMSGAYGLAAQTDSIFSHPHSLIGSVGVMSQSVYYDDLMKAEGIEVITIRYKHSPEKSLPLNTPEGEKAWQEIIDDFGDLFIDSIAKGRKIEASNVITTFGKGASFIGKKALKRNMIDAIIEMNSSFSNKEKLSFNDKDTKLNNMEEVLDMPTDTTQNTGAINPTPETVLNGNAVNTYSIEDVEKIRAADKENVLKKLKLFAVSQEVIAAINSTNNAEEIAYENALKAKAKEAETIKGIKADDASTEAEINELSVSTTQKAEKKSIKVDGDVPDDTVINEYFEKNKNNSSEQNRGGLK